MTTSAGGSRRLTIRLLSALSVVVLTPPAVAQTQPAMTALLAARSAAQTPRPEPPTFDIRWDQGLVIEALRESFTLRIGGSAQNDSAAFSDTGTETANGVIKNGVEWRRARLFAKGIVARHFEYSLQYDFAVNSPPNLKDAYLQFNAPFVPLVVRGGRFRTPMGLEGSTSGMDTTFLERGLIYALAPSRNTGVLFITDASRQRHSFRGVFGAVKPEDDIGFRSTDLLGVSGRFSYAFHPWNDDLLLHAGASYTHRPVDDTVRFAQRPEAHIAPLFADTGDFAAASVDTAIFEFALGNGPLSVQAESLISSANRAQADTADPFFWGGYAFVSWFITGETRPYDESLGSFARQRVDSPFLGPDGSGVGAFELALRVSHLDLDDQEVSGGRITDLTLGVNWYATRNARVLTNVVRSRASQLQDPVWIAQVRLQWAY